MSEQPPSRPTPPTDGPQPDPTRPLRQDSSGRPLDEPAGDPSTDATASGSDQVPSRGRRAWERVVAARVLIGVALAALLVGILGTAGIAALAGGHDGRDGSREGRGHHVRHDGDQRGGFGERRGMPPGTPPEGTTPGTTPDPSTTPTPSASTT